MLTLPSVVVVPSLFKEGSFKILRNGLIATSLHNTFKSLPLYPSTRDAAESRNAPLEKMDEKGDSWEEMISFRHSAFGSGIKIRFSIRRRKAGSRSQGRLLAARTNTAL